MKKALKILAMPTDDGGCGMYRVRQPFEMISANTEHDTHVVDKESDDMLATAIAFSVADIIVCRPGADIADSKRSIQSALASFSKEIGKKLELHAKWVVDIDDNTEVISPYNFHFNEYGTYEYYDKTNQKWLWKDGVGGFDLKKNITRAEKLKQSLRDADLITVTTPKLAQHALTYNKHVSILPNCIQLGRWWHIANNQGGFRLGWSGGISHYDDFYSVKEPLNQFLADPEVTLHLAGNGFPGILSEANKLKLREYEWVPFKGHSYRMMAMQLNAALIPLADLPFNHHKSSIKWYEMSALGIPSIVANVEPYNTEIEDGDTGLLYSTPKECLAKLTWVKNNPQAAAKIGQNARKWVEEHRDASKEYNRWIEAYQGVM